MLMTTVSCLGRKSGVVPEEHWTSLLVEDNSVLHYLYNMAVGLVIYCKASAFKAKTMGQGQKLKAKAKAKKFALRPRPRTNIAADFNTVITV